MKISTKLSAVLSVPLLLSGLAACDDGRLKDGDEDNANLNVDSDDDDDDDDDDDETAGVSGLPTFDTLDTGDDDDDDDGDDGGDGGGMTGNPDDHDDNCGEVMVEFDPLPPNIMFVLDKSGSMTRYKWMDGGQEVTRWFSLHGIVSGILNKFDSTVNFGMKYFPHKGATNANAMNGCMVDAGVHVEVGPNHAQMILDTIPAAEDTFEGHTPTLDGLRDAVEYMKSLDDQNAEAIVLVVDGDTNCMANNTQVADVAADAFANDVPVYVVGVDLTDAIANELTEVAMKGGTEKVFNSSDADALQDALESLIREIGNCTIPLRPDPPKFPKYVEVVVDGEEVPWVPGVSSCDDAADDGMADGWVYTTDEAPWDEIELCGSYCQQYLETLKVDVTYECPPPS